MGDDNLKNKLIIMTGGGSAGHVTPNLALVPELNKEGFEIQYIGTKDGIERKIIKDAHIKYHIISSGKLRRYFDLKNFTDPIKVIKGVFDAAKIIKKEKPAVVFSKGGFVSVPVVIAAHFNKVPVIIHESDITPGLANKISIPFCNKLCVTFPESLNDLKGNKIVLSGTPIRKELLNGNREVGLGICGFTGGKPILMIIGGSLGSRHINTVVRESLDELLKDYDIIHICGKGNLDNRLNDKPGYAQFEFIEKELPHFFAACDLVISRAGSNVIFELLALKKPNILIPLSKKSSRGDQILNAASFEKSGFSMVIQEEKLNSNIIIKKTKELYDNKKKYIDNMKSSKLNDSISIIISIIKKYSDTI